ncbi:hypothetical protein WMY93_007706 [Mugilogobius chulae]|uniref:Uncharacterized protein n=1 Tax=Mugilogobius chulae TaxID=88201 RepID=A0AAW0PDX2_9GOBI
MSGGVSLVAPHQAKRRVFVTELRSEQHYQPKYLSKHVCCLENLVISTSSLVTALYNCRCLGSVTGGAGKCDKASWL